MEFCEEYWVLMSSMRWADEIHGGLKCFASQHLNESSIDALKMSINEICSGLCDDNSWEEHNEWSSKLTGVFAWKWLLNTEEFKILGSFASPNLRRFPDLNTLFCYEIIKSNNWTHHICNFLQSFNSETYIEMIHHFIDNTLLSSNFDISDGDIDFFISFTDQVLISLIDSTSERLIHPLVQCSEMNKLEIASTAREETIKLFLKVFTKIFEKIQNVDMPNFKRMFLLQLSFLNNLSVLWTDSCLHLSSVNGLPIKNLPHKGGNDDVWSDDIMKYELVRMSANDDGHHFIGKSQSRDIDEIATKSLNSLVEFYKNDKIVDCISMNLVAHRECNEKHVNFSGFCLMDIYFEKFIGNLNYFKENIVPTLTLTRILDLTSPFYVKVCQILELKKIKSDEEEFKLKILLASLESKQEDFKGCLGKLLNFFGNNNELVQRQVKCLQLNIELINDSESFLNVYDFVGKQYSQPHLDITLFEDMRKLLNDAYLKARCSVKDEIVYNLSMMKGSSSHKISIIKDVESLEHKWKCCVNRISNSKLQDEDEMLQVMSQLLLLDTKSLLEKIFLEVTLNINISKGIVLLLGHFPKVFKLQSEVGGTSLFCDFFSFFYFSLKDMKKQMNLLKMLENLVSRRGKSASSLPWPLVDLDDIAECCILPIISQNQTPAKQLSDLHLVELYLKVLGEGPAVSNVVQFAYVGIFAYMSKRLEDVYSGVRTNVNCPEPENSLNDFENDFDSIYARKCQLLKLSKMWKKVYNLHFSNDEKLKGLLTALLDNFSWRVKNQFVGCLIADVILPQSLQHLLPNCNIPEKDIDLWTLKCIEDLVDFVEISDAMPQCIDLELHKLLPVADNNLARVILLKKVCQKLPLLLDEEWSRLCNLLKIFASLYSDESSNDSAGLQEESRVCRLLCDLCYVLSELRRADILGGSFPWSRCCQLFVNFMESCLRKSNFEDNLKACIKNTCIVLYDHIPSHCIADFLRQVL